MQYEDVYIDAIFEEESPTQGASKPLLITASNKKQYLLKNQIVRYSEQEDYQNQDAEFFQECLVSNIANRLDIPSPNYVAVTIDKDTLSTFSNLRWKHNFREGKYFATERITDTVNDLTQLWNIALENEQPYTINKWHNLFKNVINKTDFAAIICLDFFTLNFDRFTNSGNLLFQQRGNGKFILSIDYGFCFSNPFWSMNSKIHIPPKIEILRFNDILSKKISGLQYSADLTKKFLLQGARLHQQKWKYGFVFDALQREIQFDECNPFSKIIYAIESLTDQDIYKMIDDIPTDWIVSDSIQKQAYASFLIRQRDLLRGFIEYNLNQNIFTNFTGGDLAWEKGKNMNSL